MTAPPVDDHTQEFEELAGLSALGALEGDERPRFEHHAAGCERCRLIVQLDRETLRQLSLAAPEMDPSPDFKRRLLQRATDELAAAAQGANAEPRPHLAPVTPRPATPTAASDSIAPAAPSGVPRAAPSNVIPFWRRPWVAALAAVLVLGIGSLGALSYMNQVVATYALSSSSVPGSASVVVHRSGRAELQMDGVPDPGPGYVYEAWIIPPGKQPVAAGTLEGGQGRVGLAGDVRGSTVAVTREPTPVPPQPSSPPLMAQEIQS